MKVSDIYVFTVLIYASNGQSTDLSESLSNSALIKRLIEEVDSLKDSVQDLKQENLDLKSKLEKVTNRLSEVEQLNAVDVEEGSNEEISDTVSVSLPVRSQKDATILRGQRQLMGIVGFTSYLDHVSTLGKDQAVVFNKVVTNEGQGYSSNTGIFRAPVPGLYLFSWAVTARKQQGLNGYNIWAKLMMNGNHTVEAVAESYTDTEDNQGSNTAVLMMSRGDEVWVAHEGSADRIHGDQVERSTSFTGALLVQTEDNGPIVGK
ncbi:uncharacterized protein LOC128204803 [Mya arenaria]|uniref:uncharacterized protein LOC128204803 n=1 Tax=Mya arenaria TaxID=6604 RepID=UPI0022E23EBE|nr:uncharacterized protein LOC128204803 [Mya arenaria]